MRIIDISLTVDSALPVWPGDPAIVIERFLDIDRGDVVNASRIGCSLHTGSHVDAPLHHLQRGEGVEALSLSTMIGSVVVADFEGAEAIGARELEALGLGPGVERLLCRTRNSRLWRESPGAFRENFVAVTPDGARWIVEHGIRLVGVDYLSVERFAADPPDTHRTLLRAGVVILEGLDLGEAAPGEYTLVCLPWKVRGADGAPARAVLIEGDVA